MLLNRHGERRLLDQLVADVRAGESRALGVRGDAGIGKTALLEYVQGRASDYRSAPGAGVEAERELAFATCRTAHDDEPGTAAGADTEPVPDAAVTPAIGPLPPLLVRARPRRTNPDQ